MGMFSWTTSDTDESIMNQYSNQHKPVYLLQPNGQNITCINYDGYGRFTTESGDIIDLPNGQWIKDAFDNECMSYNGLPLKFSFNRIAVYEELEDSPNCPIQGHDWSL